MSQLQHGHRAADTIVPRAKVWLEVDGEYVFGRGISDILKAVEETGSIKAAADQLGKSYRFVWAKIKKAEKSLDASLVCTRVGGKDARRSELTDLARNLVQDFDAFRSQIFELVNREFQRRIRNTLEEHSR